MRTGRQLAAVRGRTARVTRLDGCGRRVVGEYNHVVTEGVVTASFTAATSEEAEIEVKNFGGKRLVYEPSVAEIAGYNLELNFQQVDFELFEILTGQTLVFDAKGRVVGLEVDTKIKTDKRGFAIETWTGTAADDACDGGGEGEWGYLLLPNVKGGYLGDFSIENGAISFTITGASTRDGNQWGRGAFPVELDSSDAPALLHQALTTTAALRMQIVNLAPPEATAGARPIMDATKTALTSIAAAKATGDATKMTADFTATPTGGPVYYDFGDGTWDYVNAPGSASHKYEVAGTYVARATTNGSAWKTVNVTVPYA